MRPKTNLRPIWWDTQFVVIWIQRSFEAPCPKNWSLIEWDAWFLCNFDSWLFYVELSYPTLPSSHRVRKWLNSTMKDLGLHDGSKGSWLQVDLAIEELMRHVGSSPINGKLHVQIMADVRVYRKTAFTTVALRALQAGQDYSSMTTMTIL